jgi:hypothetical protein
LTKEIYRKTKNFFLIEQIVKFTFSKQSSLQIQKNNYPIIGGSGGISSIWAAAAANKSASDIEPNVDDFLDDPDPVFSGLEAETGFFLGSLWPETASDLVLPFPDCDDAAAADPLPNKMLVMLEGKPLNPVK